MIEFRSAIVPELAQLKTFLFEHGANPWNYLPCEGVDKEFELVANGAATALVAFENQTLVGFVIFCHPQALPNAYLEYTHTQPAIFISEAVVHRDYAGRGIGHRLLARVIDRATDFGASMLVIDRHDENAASAGMMRKAGFVVLKTFVDLERRHYGNHKTTVLGLQLTVT